LIVEDFVRYDYVWLLSIFNFILKVYQLHFIGSSIDIRVKLIDLFVITYYIKCYCCSLLYLSHVSIITHIPASFDMYLLINKCVTPVKVSNFSGHSLHNRSTLDIGVLGYIGIF
jgi:hypothetical protein